MSQLIKDPKFAHVAVAYEKAEPTDQEVCALIDDVIAQTFGPKGLAALVKPGDRVTIKTNIVCAWQGARGEKGRGVITDPRICRYVAEKVREVIGWDNGADLRVVDACFTDDPNPSGLDNPVGFHGARLNRIPDNLVHPEDITYDYNGNGILDGTSGARLINLDSLGAEDRELHEVTMASGRKLKVAFPKFLRRKEDATDGGDYTDVFIGLPVFKNHGFIGCTGSLKLHYGFRSLHAYFGDTGRRGHSGMYSVNKDGTITAPGRFRLNEYLIAQHKVRSYDLVIMDCLTANRNGPCSPTGAVSLTPDPHEAVDYLLTNAIMASTDPVAIDTVESTLGGYVYNSIDLTRIAAENGIGVREAADIQVNGLEKFTRLRKHLLATYGPEGRYPLTTSGDPELAATVLPQYTVTMDGFTTVPDKNGFHHVRYTVHPIGDAKPDIRRIDLVVAECVKESIVGDDIPLTGEFVFRHADYDNMGGAYVVGLISAWDGLFNCVNSTTEFFIPPDGCEDDYI